MRTFSQDYHRNSVILDSLPIRHDLVRYFSTKFRIVCSTRGYSQGSDAFKALRELMMRYISDVNRHENIKTYYREYPFRKNGWMRCLFQYADTSPHAVLDLLKMYTSFKQPLMTVEESSIHQHQYLSSREPSTSPVVTELLSNWILYVQLLGQGIKLQPDWIEKGRIVRRSIERYTGIAGSEPQFGQDLWNYSRSWFKSMFSQRYSKREIIEPSPHIYKDMIGNLSSETFQEDLDGFANLMAGVIDPDTERGTKLMELREVLSSTTLPFLPDNYIDFYAEDWGLLGFAGRVHHIPKKGTVKRRPIAVPNRFFQAGLLPLQKDLYDRIAQLPRDCTFDQNRFLHEIQSRINSGKFVQGVDLSQATDNIPYQWFKDICLKFNDISSDSLRQFEILLELPWWNGDFDSYWTKGQPLGTLPSFGILAITHNAILEAMSFYLGYKHSPYVVLGDDLLIFDKKLADLYISCMQIEGIPLSLHKSYSGRLVEFAGRIYIRNQHPWYTSDHSVVTMTSLFDYQRSTGIRIPFANLPSNIRKQLGRLCSTPDHAQKAYDLVSYAETGQNLPQRLSVERGLIEFFRLLVNNKPVRASDESTGFYTLRENGQTRVYHTETMRKSFSSPSWFTKKVRPYTVKHLISTAEQALVLAAEV